MSSSSVITAAQGRKLQRIGVKLRCFFAMRHCVCYWLPQKHKLAIEDSIQSLLTHICCAWPRRAATRSEEMNHKEHSSRIRNMAGEPLPHYMLMKYFVEVQIHDFTGLEIRYRIINRT